MLSISVKIRSEPEGSPGSEGQGDTGGAAETGGEGGNGIKQLRRCSEDCDCFDQSDVLISTGSTEKNFNINNI